MSQSRLALLQARNVLFWNDLHSSQLGRARQKKDCYIILPGGQKDIVFLTEDTNLINKYNEKHDDIHVMSVKQYIKQYILQNKAHALDMYDSLCCEKGGLFGCIIVEQYWKENVLYTNSSLILFMFDR